MGRILSAARSGLALVLCLGAKVGMATVPCPEIARSGFESGPALQLQGAVGGLSTGTVELRSGATVLASAEIFAGSFTVMLSAPGPAPEQRLELRARGLDLNDDIELASLLGSAGRLLPLADEDGVIRIGRAPQLAVTPESTARYALLLPRTAPEDWPQSDCEQGQDESGLNPDEVLRRTAVIQILIDDRTAGKRALSLNPTTLDTVSDPVALQNAIDSIEMETPGRLASTVTALSRPFCSAFDAEAILANQERFEGQWMNIFTGELFTNLGAGNGRHINFSGSDPYTWSCSGDVGEFDLEGTRVSVGFAIRTVNGAQIQVRAETRIDHIRLTRLSSELDRMIVAAYQTQVRSFPENPELPDESLPGQGRLVLVPEPPGPAFVALDLPGTYLMPSSGLSGNREANHLRIDAGGTGQDLDADLPLNWQVGADGRLELQFLDGGGSLLREVRLLPFRAEAPQVLDTLWVAQNSDGSAVVDSDLVLRETSTGLWQDDASVPDFYLANAGRIVTDSTTFYWELRDDAERSAPTYIKTSDGSTTLQSTYHWSRPEPGRVVLRRCFSNGAYIALLDREPQPGECTAEYRRREWRLYTEANGNYYVRETQNAWLGIDSDQPPNGGGLIFDRAAFYNRRAVAP